MFADRGYNNVRPERVEDGEASDEEPPGLPPSLPPAPLPDVCEDDVQSEGVGVH